MSHLSKYTESSVRHYPKGGSEVGVETECVWICEYVCLCVCSVSTLS